MRTFRQTRLGLEDRLLVDAALDHAFAPLRAGTTNISPARVRAAVRWSPPQPARPNGLTLLARIGELATAAVISALVFSASLTSLSPAGTMPDASRDPARAGEWILNGRGALQRPMDSRATDYRTTAGDLAANAATVRREATSTERGAEQNASNQ